MNLTYYYDKKHMSNSTKGITTVTNFMITCPLDQLMRHIISILGDIMVLLLRILIATNLHQQLPNS